MSFYVLRYFMREPAIFSITHVQHISMTDSFLDALEIKLMFLRASGSCAALWSLVESSFADVDFSRYRLTICLFCSRLVPSVSPSLLEEFWAQPRAGPFPIPNFEGIGILQASQDILIAFSAHLITWRPHSPGSA